MFMPFGQHQLKQREESVIYAGDGGRWPYIPVDILYSLTLLSRKTAFFE